MAKQNKQDLKTIKIKFNFIFPSKVNRYLITKVQKLLLGLKIQIFEVIIQPGWQLDRNFLGKDDLRANVKGLAWISF